MCLSTQRKTATLRPETAKSDIIVYKVLTSSNKSPIMWFEYQPNTLYRLRKPLQLSGKMMTVGVRPKKYTFEYSEGFHSFNDLGSALTSFMYTCLPKHFHKVVEFVIPKGAKYIVGDDNDIISISIRSGDLKRCA